MGLLRVPLRIFHDVKDREVPVESGEAIAREWPGAVLTRTEGLGHHRILYAPEVVKPGVSMREVLDHSVALGNFRHINMTSEDLHHAYVKAIDAVRTAARELSRFVEDLYED